MDNWHVFLIIALALGVIISNMLAIKHLDKIKIPPLMKKPPSFPKPIDQQIKEFDEAMDELNEDAKRTLDDNKPNA